LNHNKVILRHMSSLNILTGYEAASKPQVTRFSGAASDWCNWEFEFKTLAHEIGLADYTDPVGSDSEERELLDKKDVNAKFFRILVASCDGDAKTTLRNDVEVGNGRGAWLVLKERYCGVTPSRIVSIYQELFSVPPATVPGDFEQFINRILSLRTQLSDVGEKISDVAVYGLLKNGLPHEAFSPLFLQFESRTPLDLGKDLPKLKALALELARRSRDASSMELGMRVVKHTRRCFVCGSSDHLRAECPKGNVVKCSVCGRSGHPAKKCRRRSEAKPNTANLVHDKDSYDQAWVANEVFPSKRENGMCQVWSVDSGASAHMSGVRSDFVNLREIPNHFVKVANNTMLPAPCVGDVCLMLRARDGRLVQLVVEALFVPGLCTRLFSVGKAIEAPIALPSSNS
jgi:hypothetical protein